MGLNFPNAELMQAQKAPEAQAAAPAAKPAIKDEHTAEEAAKTELAGAAAQAANVLSKAPDPIVDGEKKPEGVDATAGDKADSAPAETLTADQQAALDKATDAANKKADVPVQNAQDAKEFITEITKSLKEAGIGKMLGDFLKSITAIFTGALKGDLTNPDSAAKTADQKVDFREIASFNAMFKDAAPNSITYSAFNDEKKGIDMTTAQNQPITAPETGTQEYDASSKTLTFRSETGEVITMSPVTLNNPAEAGQSIKVAAGAKLGTVEGTSLQLSDKKPTGEAIDPGSKIATFGGTKVDTPAAAPAPAPKKGAAKAAGKSGEKPKTTAAKPAAAPAATPPAPPK